MSANLLSSFLKRILLEVLYFMGWSLICNYKSKLNLTYEIQVLYQA